MVAAAEVGEPLAMAELAPLSMPPAHAVSPKVQAAAVANQIVFIAHPSLRLQSAAITGTTTAGRRTPFLLPSFAKAVLYSRRDRTAL
jgi:hypothetical protein